MTEMQSAERPTRELVNLWVAGTLSWLPFRGAPEASAEGDDRLPKVAAREAAPTN